MQPNAPATEQEVLPSQAELLTSIQTKSRVLDGIKIRQVSGELDDPETAVAFQRITQERKDLQSQLNPLIIVTRDGISCRTCSHFSFNSDREEMCYAGDPVYCEDSRSEEGLCGPEASFYEG